MSYFKHGQTIGGGMSPTYRSWAQMLQRCNNPKDPSYSKYGGAGITSCNRWQGFDNFFADMGERIPGTTIDRVNNNGNYEPGNCRWATRREQQNNRRTNVRIDLDGRTCTLAEWSRHFGIPYPVVKKRWAAGDKSYRLFRSVEIQFSRVRRPSA